MLAQLLALDILPALHVTAGLHHPATVSHAEPANGGHSPERPDGHDEAGCQYCRVAEARYAYEAAAVPAAPVAESLQAGRHAMPAWHGTQAVIGTHASRAPPLS